MRNFLKSLLIVILLGISLVFIGFLSIKLYEGIIAVAQEVDLYLYQLTDQRRMFALLEAEGQEATRNNRTLAHNPNPPTVGPALDIAKDLDGTTISAEPVKPTSPNTPKPTKARAKQPASTAKKQPPSANPAGPRIIIPKIGVDTRILIEGPLRKRMYKGVSIHREYNNFNRNDRPVILTSHRFGYIWWSPSYRRKNSFYNLHKIKQGDIILIVRNGKRLKYRVYKTTIDTKIKDYNADLILYTCVNYTSPKRIIVYAKIIK